MHLDEFIQRDSNEEIRLPIDDQKLFNEYIIRFVEEDPYGIDALQSNKLGFVKKNDVDGKIAQVLQFMEISALSIGSTNSTISDKQPIYEAWEAVIADFS